MLNLKAHLFVFTLSNGLLAKGGPFFKEYFSRMLYRRRLFHSTNIYELALLQAKKNNLTQISLNEKKSRQGLADGLGKHKEVWTVVKVAGLHRKRCVAAHI